ncbi:uncharacterized protein EI97DRAFT_78247 [Westerdykella ornata]|uniref:Uncharacterized protein n=1 Tax=Westerdykella ornata TaxID=318751 RepID=A0A6A6JF00_WESOR|nr:uncharacterized protein EI97DRAFT_78247 [Westerdykella ornata]KAF2275131.1 hypothetical protein EI97DRAFT_78247 [Westerdykella ornata]
MGNRHDVPRQKMFPLRSSGIKTTRLHPASSDQSFAPPLTDSGPMSRYRPSIRPHHRSQ